MFWTIDVPINTSLLYSNFDFKIIELDFLRIGDELIMDLFIHDYRYTGYPILIYPDKYFEKDTEKYVRWNVARNMYFISVTLCFF